jgi:hypothetical protein
MKTTFCLSFSDPLVFFAVSECKCGVELKGGEAMKEKTAQQEK